MKLKDLLEQIGSTNADSGWLHMYSADSRCSVGICWGLEGNEKTVANAVGYQNYNGGIEDCYNTIEQRLEDQKNILMKYNKFLSDLYLEKELSDDEISKFKAFVKELESLEYSIK